MIGLLAIEPRVCAAAPATEVRGGYGDYLAGMIARRNRNFAAASDYMHRSYRQGRAGAPLKEAYIGALEAGRMERAEGLAPLLAGRVSDPEDYWIDLQRGVSALRDLDYESARGVFATAAKTPGLARAATASLLEIWATFGSGARETAWRLVTDLPRRQKDYAAAMYGLHHALLLAAADDRQAAQRILAEHIGDLPLSVPFSIYTGAILASGDGGAILASGDGGAILASGDAYVEPVTNALQGGTAILLQAARLAQMRGGCEEGLRYAWLADQLVGGFPPAAIERGLCYGILGDGAAAIAAYDSVPSSHPLAKMARLSAADIHHAQGRSDRALAALRQLVLEHPEDPRVRIHLGDQLRHMGRYAEAVEVYDRIDPQRDPESIWPLHYVRGVALERHGDWQRSEADLRVALSLRPDDPYIINHLAYSWIERGVHLDDAREMLEKALERLPNNGHIIDSYGWALFRRGDFFQAVRYLERAAEILPLESTVNHHLGDALAKVGRRREARYHWQRALGQNPPREEEIALRRKLDAAPSPPSPKPPKSPL